MLVMTSDEWRGFEGLDGERETAVVVAVVEVVVKVVVVVEEYGVGGVGRNALAVHIWNEFELVLRELSVDCTEVELGYSVPLIWTMLLGCSHNSNLANK